MSYGYIYKTTCLINGHVYIGQHKYDKECLDENYIGSGKILINEINKYGVENFSCEILTFCDTKEDLDKQEIEFINKYKNSDITCINITSGGTGGDTISACKWYNNGEKEMYFSSNDIIPEDFKPGRLTDVYSPIGTKWVNNGVNQKQVLPDKYDEYINNGWKNGMLDRSLEWRSKVGRYKRTKEITQKMVNKRNETYLLEPERKSKTRWKNGHIPCNKGKISITNGVTNKYIEPLEDIPAGWHKGNTQQHKKSRKASSKDIKKEEI